MTPPTTKIISRADYDEHYKRFVGIVRTIIFPYHYYDCTRFVDLIKLRRNLESNYDYDLKRKRILNVLITTDQHPNFINEKNPDIYLKQPTFCPSNGPGAFAYSDGVYMSHYVVGDAFVLLSK